MVVWRFGVGRGVSQSAMRGASPVSRRRSDWSTHPREAQMQISSSSFERSTEGCARPRKARWCSQAGTAAAAPTPTRRRPAPGSTRTVTLQESARKGSVTTPPRSRAGGLRSQDHSGVSAPHRRRSGCCESSRQSLPRRAKATHRAVSITPTQLAHGGPSCESANSPAGCISR